MFICATAPNTLVYCYPLAASIPIPIRPAVALLQSRQTGGFAGFFADHPGRKPVNPGFLAPPDTNNPQKIAILSRISLDVVCEQV